MSTITLIRPPTPSATGDPPSLGEMLEKTLPLIGVAVVAGPPVILNVAPLVLFALMPAGAFTLAATLAPVGVVARFAAGGVVNVSGAIVATPYLRVRHLHAHRERDAHIGASARQLIGVEPRLGTA